MSEDLDAFHEHEALHTAHVVMSTWYDHVETHPFVQADAELVDLAEKATSAMMDLYQAIGGVVAGSDADA